MGNRNKFLFKTTNEEEHNDEYCKTSELVAGAPQTEEKTTDTQ
jgi:hypothetical protein